MSEVKKPYPLFKSVHGKTGYSVFHVPNYFFGKPAELSFTNIEIVRARKRTERMKLKIATQFERLTGSQMQGIQERSLGELAQVLQYQRSIMKPRRRH